MVAGPVVGWHRSAPSARSRAAVRGEIAPHVVGLERRRTAAVELGLLGTVHTACNYPAAATGTRAGAADALASSSAANKAKHTWPAAVRE